MSLNTRLSDLVVNIQADALAVLLNNGYIRIYDGAQPASADDPITTQNKLAELRFSSPAFGAAVGGVIIGNPFTPDNDAAATGIASWFRTFKADGVTAMFDGSAGRNQTPSIGDVYNMNLDVVNIQQHAHIMLTPLVHAVIR